MSLPPPSTLVSITSGLISRPVPWEGHVRSQTITESEMKLIKAIDKASAEKRKAAVEENPDGYKSLLLGDGSGDGKSLLERSSKRTDLIQYVLAVVWEVLEDVPSFADTLLLHPQPYAPFLSFLSHQNDNPSIISASILTSLVSASLQKSSVSDATKDALPTLLKFLSYSSTTEVPDSSVLDPSSSTSSMQDMAVQCYVSLCRTSYGRLVFWDIGNDVMKGLVDVIESAAAGSGSRDTAVGLGTTSTFVSQTTSAASGNLSQGGVALQLLYHVLLVIWEITFEEQVAEEMNPKYDLIPPLVSILRSAIKEKILRLTLAIISNLILKAPDTNLPPLLLTRILPLLTTLQSRNFNDPDLTNDMSNILSSLETFQMTQTTLDEYATEIRSGHLTWSPPHRSDDFWKKNARGIMELNSGELPKCLARALKQENQEKTVLAVAAHDVGRMVKEVPEKRKVWETLGVKGVIMGLMAHEDPEVRFESLRAVQEFLRFAFGG